MVMLIQGGTVIDPANGRHEPLDVVVAEGRIVELRAPGGPSVTGERIDASGCWVVPGLIDMHVHLREPGFEYKETIETGARSAVAGGFTAVACMANTEPVNDSAAVTRFIRERAEAVGLARVYPIGAVSLGLKGQRLAEIGEMRAAGIVAVSDDGHAIGDSLLMRRALEYSVMFDLPVIVHEEDPGLADDGCMHEGPTSFRLGLRGIPAAAEEIMVARDIALAQRTGGRLHVAHLSTAGSVALVRRAKQDGLPVTAEVAPHHFTLTDAAVASYDTNAKMKPPLRAAEDVDAVIAGLRDGVIDAIATDHAPHHRDEKDVEFEAAANGIVGLETAVPLTLRLVRECQVPIDVVIRALSTNPARILGVPGGTLAPESPADITVIDPNAEWSVEPERLASKSRNTPFGGWTMTGRAVCTIVGGRIVWRAESTNGTMKTKRSAAR